MALRFVIIGGGPAGTQAAASAARLGAEVTVVERDVVGGAAHLWDCVPSKAMIATGAAYGSIGDAARMGLTAEAARIDLDSMRSRIGGIIIAKRDSSPLTRTGLPSSSMLLSMITGDSLKRKFLIGWRICPFSM